MSLGSGYLSHFATGKKIFAHSSIKSINYFGFLEISTTFPHLLCFAHANFHFKYNLTKMWPRFVTMFVADINFNKNIKLVGFN